MFNLFILLIIFCTLLFLAVLVILKNYKNKINIYFSGLSGTLGIWLMIVYFEDVVPIETAKLLVKADFFIAVLLGTFFYLTCLNFPYKKYNKMKDYYVFFMTVPISLLALTEFTVKELIYKNPGYEYITGPLFIITVGYIGLLTVFGGLSLYFKYKQARGINKRQIQYVMLGATITGVILLIVNAILPRFFETTVTFTRLGIYTSVIFVAFTYYAIVKHHLMDIRMVVARSVAYSMLLLIFAGFYSSTIFIVQSYFFHTTFAPGYIAVQMILAVIMAFSFQPLRHWITKVTDKVFFKNQYNAEELLDELAHTIGSTIVLVEMLFKTLNLLRQQMKVSRGIFVVLTDAGKIYNYQATGFQNSLKLDEDDMLKLAKDGILVADELEENSRYKHLLKKYDVSVSIPIKTDNTTEGVLLLGEKLSGDMFNQTDMKVFEIIAPELAVAITNGKAFEKIERFNVTLRQEVKKATHELEKKNEQLRELDKAKDEFISMASHQLRTPLTAIKGYLSMLLEGDAGEIRVSQYDFVNEAFNGANRMVGLINDLLNVSRMETGRFFLEPVEVDLVKLVDEEVKQLQNHAKEKKLYLKYEPKGKIPKIMADETKIRQVVMNFIDNAVYYTTEGGVTVTLEADKHDVIFKVTDTGIGVPKDQQKNLFTKFYRADNARHVRPDGTGLGIYLAKRVMDDHGGELIFHSKEGKGSTFGFKFPLKSKLKMKPVSAPVPGGETKPAIGELAAGIGVSAETLEATQKPAAEIPQDKIDIAKAAGVEAPLPDSPDAKEMAKESDLIKKAAAEVKEPAKK